MGKVDFYPVFFFMDDFNGFAHDSCIYFDLPSDKRHKAS
jgi:hypothetical protein